MSAPTTPQARPPHLSIKMPDGRDDAKRKHMLTA